MPKRHKDSTQGRGKSAHKGYYYPPDVRAPGRPTRSSQRREALHEVSGQPYDRDPCPHVLRTRELAVAETFPIKVGDVITYDRPCVRPGAHVREQKVTTVPDPAHPGDPHRVIEASVPDEAARLHADASGQTWS